MSEGKVLVVLPTLGDRLAYLEETLRTIDAERARVDLTLAVVLPAGAVQARSIAEAHQAVIVEDPRRGISEAINAGIRAATNEEYYAWIGDDDLFRPGALTQLRDLLEANPDAVVSYGGCDYIDPQGTAHRNVKGWQGRAMAASVGSRPHPASGLDDPTGGAARCRAV